MRKIYCDCCRREIRDTAPLFSMEIKRGQDKEIVIEDMCDDCYAKIKHVVDHAQLWILSDKQSVF